MTLSEAQDIAEQVANFHSKKVTREQMRQALVRLANFYEDVRFSLEQGNKEEKE
jgi:hypothetical protein